MRLRLLGLFSALLLCPAPAADNTYVRFTTNLGNIDVQLLSDEAPLNVANFLHYVDNHLYDASIFHRSVSSFVLQGGAFLDQVDSQSQLVPIATFAPVVHEISGSNARGTLAMALGQKTGTNGDAVTDEDSATDSWFFNTVDNNNPLGNDLDAQVQGDGSVAHFTVVGRIADGSSLAVMDYLASFPTATGTQIPVINYTGSLTLANLIVVDSIARVTLTPFSSWQSTAFTPDQKNTAGFTDSGATPWQDGTPNLLKYLCGIDPSRPMSVADRAALPILGTLSSGSNQFLSLSYRRASSATGLTVVLQTSSNLVNWTDSANAPFQNGVDASGNLLMEFAVPFSTSVRFLRLRVTGG